MLAFCREGVREADPGRAEVWVHHGGFGEEAPGFGDAADAEVVDADGEPGAGFFWVQVGEVVGEEEEGVGFGEFVQAGEMERVDGEVEIVGGEDGCGYGEGFFEAALGEEELGFGQEEVGVGGEVVVRGQGFGGVDEVGGIFVFGEAGGVEHLCELGGFLRSGRVFGGN